MKNSMPVNNELPYIRVPRVLLSDHAAGLLSHGISPLSINRLRIVQNRFWWLFVKRYAQLGQE